MTVSFVPVAMFGFMPLSCNRNVPFISVKYLVAWLQTKLILANFELHIITQHVVSHVVVVRIFRRRETPVKMLFSPK